jgi:hypothetical protein
MRWWRTGLVVVVMLGVAAGPSLGQRFYPDDPIWEDPDRMDMPAPKKRGASGGFDPVAFLNRAFGEPGTYSGPAANVNTLGEVPNSSWYTNRHYHDRMSRAELVQGPNTGTPPDTTGPWKVVEVEEQSGLPRATFRDPDGRTYRLSVDGRRHPRLATGAAMIASRLLHALGYNVPEHYLRHVYPDRLVPAADSVARGEVWRIFNAAPPRPDGSYRVLVTRIPDADVRLGPFAFHGTRADDANDIFPHEARRELRGLRVMAAWINHSKIRSSRTMDVLVDDDGRQFVRHYLTDFLATLGSGGPAPKPKWSGHEHILEIRAVLTRMGTLGLSGGEWMEATAPDLPGVGHFEAEYFEPGEWKPESPNPAFMRTDSMDAFWAARQVAHFTPEELEAVVRTAQYGDSASTAYVLQTLRRRQTAIAEAYLGYGGGLDRFSVKTRTLHFTDLLHRHGLAPDSVRRRVRWHVFDNAANRVTDRLRTTTTPDESIPLPLRAPPFLRATLTTPGRGTTRVYLRKTPSEAYEVVGVERGEKPPP